MARTPEQAATRLREAERSAAAPYIDYPPAPAWYPPAGGVWATGLAASLLLVHGDTWATITRLALDLVLVAFVSWYVRKRGTMPSLRGVPAELRRAFAAYLGGLALIGLVLAASALWLPVPITLVLTFVLVTAGLYAYETCYARAAEETRARLR
ncbi:MAG: hypothetical protein ACTHNS_04125 [Marmoricola sp.]